MCGCGHAHADSTYTCVLRGLGVSCGRMRHVNIYVCHVALLAGIVSRFSLVAKWTLNSTRHEHGCVGLWGVYKLVAHHRTSFVVTSS